MKSRGRRSKEPKRQRARAEVEVVLPEGVTLADLDIPLDRLRQLYRRIQQRQLEPEDWELLRAMLPETK
jgi:hypothetical protein